MHRHNACGKNRQNQSQLTAHQGSDPPRRANARQMTTGLWRECVCIPLNMLSGNKAYKPMDNQEKFKTIPVSWRLRFA
jgi:hypothetical protein